jgi:putative zinc- or iron-chelating protein
VNKPLAGKVHFRIEEGSFRFSGDCPNCWSVCQAVCCRVAVVPLADEEIAEGKYDTQVENGVTVLKRTADGCTYLKGFKCSIYKDRPAACRAFDCSKHLWRMLPQDMPRASEPPAKTVRTLKVDGTEYHYSPPRRKR